MCLVCGGSQNGNMWAGGKLISYWTTCWKRAKRKKKVSCWPQNVYVGWLYGGRAFETRDRNGRSYIDDWVETPWMTDTLRLPHGKPRRWMNHEVCNYPIIWAIPYPQSGHGYYFMWSLYDIWCGVSHAEKYVNPKEGFYENYYMIIIIFFSYISLLTSANI